MRLLSRRRIFDQKKEKKEDHVISRAENRSAGVGKEGGKKIRECQDRDGNPKDVWGVGGWAFI